MPLDYEKLKSLTYEPVTMPYGARETILYALGVGVGLGDPLSMETLQYSSPRFLKALPTLATVLQRGNTQKAFDADVGVTWHMVVHGEQRLTMHLPLPAEAVLTSQTSLDGVWDKGPGKGALLAMRRNLYLEDGTLLAESVATAFLRADGGFNGPTEGAPRPHPVPGDRPADLALDLPTGPDQALIYQLSGDYNPLHVDPGFARQAGFEKPILHGLCHYGIACRAALKLLCGDDPARLKRFDVRFSAPMYPGETLRTEIWREGPGRAAFRALAVERNAVVQNYGLIEYR